MNPMSRYLAPIASVAMAATMLSGCGLQEKFKNAGGEVARFHAALDAERYQAIWDMTGSQFRAVTKQPDFEVMLKAVHRKLGKVAATKQVGWNANASTSGNTLTLTMETRFAQGAGTETFVFTKSADQPMKLAGYNINSQDMLLK